jgi:hypothetical protein
MADDPRREVYPQRVQSLAREGMPTFALVEQSLPGGLRAVVRFNQPEPLRRYVVMSAVGLDDALIFEARLAEIAYRTPHADDDSPTEIRLYEDRRIEITSGKNGRISRVNDASGRLEDPQRHTRRMLKRWASAAEQMVPDFGAARLVHYE